MIGWAAGGGGMSTSAAERYRDYYESVQWVAPSPRERERIASLCDAVPEGVASILELGAGDCRLSRQLAERVPIVSTDLSFSALRRSGLPAVAQADIAATPFADRSFDLVLCSEVLEHLQTAALYRALNEIRRLSKQYVLLSVPYQENLRENSAKCRTCGTVSHIYGHVRSFARGRIEHLLSPEFTPIRVWLLGPEHRCLPPLVRLRGPLSGNERMCSQCGKVSPTAPLGLVPKIVDWLQWKIPYSRPYWITALYRINDCAVKTEAKTEPRRLADWNEGVTASYPRFLSVMAPRQSLLIW